jgi:hypothetical protein
VTVVDRRERLTASLLAASGAVSAAHAARAGPGRAMPRWVLPLPAPLVLVAGPGPCGTCPGCVTRLPCAVDVAERAVAVVLHPGRCPPLPPPTVGRVLSGLLVRVLVGALGAWHLTTRRPRPPSAPRRTRTGAASAPPPGP